MTVLLFAGESYYAKGGMNDFQGAYESLQKSLETIARHAALDRSYSQWDWWQIIDQETLEVLARSESQAHGVGCDDYVPDEDE